MFKFNTLESVNILPINVTSCSLTGKLDKTIPNSAKFNYVCFKILFKCVVCKSYVLGPTFEAIQIEGGFAETNKAGVFLYYDLKVNCLVIKSYISKHQFVIWVIICIEL